MSELKGYASLQTRFTALRGPAKMRLLGLAAVREQKLLVRRKTGHTGRTIRLASATATNAVTEVRGAGPYLEFGTAPHVITPRAAKALRFAASPGGRRLTGSPRTGAAVVFARRVNHPGTKPYPFMVPGAKKAVNDFGIDTITEIWNGKAG